MGSRLKLLWDICSLSKRHRDESAQVPVEINCARSAHEGAGLDYVAVLDLILLHLHRAHLLSLMIVMRDDENKGKGQKVMSVRLRVL